MKNNENTKMRNNVTAQTPHKISLLSLCCHFAPRSICCRLVVACSRLFRARFVLDVFFGSIYCPPYCNRCQKCCFRCFAICLKCCCRFSALDLLSVCCRFFNIVFVDVVLSFCWYLLMLFDEKMLLQQFEMTLSLFW